MARRRTNAYWLLLVALILLATVTMAVGEAQARYAEDTLVFNTVAEPAQPGVTSDCLSETPLTVLLGQLPQTGSPVTFTLNSGADVSGKLTWSVDRPEYLTVGISVDGSSLKSSDTITLTAGEPETVTMFLLPTTKATAAVHEAMDVNITVIWSDTLRGTFRATLPTVTEADLSANEQPAENEDTSVPEASTQPEEENTSGFPVEISGVTSLEGRELRAGEFRFHLFAADKNGVVAEGAEPVATAVNDGSGGFTFDSLNFETEGIYCYVAAQDTSAGLGGVTYDGSRYILLIMVTQTENGDGAALQSQVIVRDMEGNESELRFDNTYIPAEAAFPLNAAVRLNGAILKADMFRFSLLQVEEKITSLGDLIQTVSNHADGTIPFDDLCLDAEGTYYYLILQDISDETGRIVYDNNIFKLEVHVEDDGNGQLTALGDVRTVDGSATETITFFNTYSPTEEDTPLLGLRTIGAFAPSETLPVWIDWVAGVDTVRLTMGGQPFPAFTRYSLDDGAGTYLLYHGDAITIQGGEAGAVELTLDFSQAASDGGADLVITAQAYDGQWPVASAAVNTRSELDSYYQMASAVLTQDAPLVITLPQGWGDEATGYMLDYSVDMLIPMGMADPDDPARKIETQYVPLGEYDTGLSMEHTANGQEHTLTISVGEYLPPAGTYRLNMNWTYEGICFEQSQITFFINYSVNQKQTEQEVPTDE